MKKIDFFAPMRELSIESCLFQPARPCPIFEAVFVAKAEPT
jgi:hypothetical protein